MQTMKWYRDPCEACNAYCCKTYPILDSRASENLIRIPIKVAGALCANLEWNNCRIYETREQNWYWDCSSYTCYWLWPLLDTWMKEKMIPMHNWWNFLEEIRQYMNWYFNIHNKVGFESILRQRIELFYERLSDLLIFCPTEPIEFSLYWQWLTADLLKRRKELD